MKSLEIEHRVVGGIPIYIFEDHSIALKAWALLRQSRNEPPMLLTLDTHTDTHEPFIRYAYSAARSSEKSNDEWFGYAEAMLSTCDWTRIETIEAALPHLRNDEHIQAAIKIGVLDAAFVIAVNTHNPTRPREYRELYSDPMAHMFHLDDELPVRPHHYDRPKDSLFYIPNCENRKRSELVPCEDHGRRMADCAIDTELLENRLAHADEMIVSTGYSRFIDSPYILDIDLDYFRTEKSTKPSDSRKFLELARGAVAVTIATEPSYVLSERLDCSVTSERNLESLLGLLAS